MPFERAAERVQLITISSSSEFVLLLFRADYRFFLLAYAAIKSFPYCRFISHRCFICSTLKCNYVVWAYETIPIFIFFHANDKRTACTLSKEKGCFWHKMKFLCLQSTVCRVCGAWQACQIKCETHVPFVKMVSWPMYTK